MSNKPKISLNLYTDVVPFDWTQRKFLKIKYLVARSINVYKEDEKNMLIQPFYSLILFSIIKNIEIWENVNELLNRNDGIVSKIYFKRFCWLRRRIRPCNSMEFLNPKSRLFEFSSIRTPLLQVKYRSSKFKIF